MLCRKQSQWQHNLIQTASGKTGAVQISLDNLYALIIAGSVLFATWQFRANRHLKFCSDLKRLEWAAEAMKEHGSALEKFMYYPTAPSSLKTFLLDASDALESRDFARLMAKRLVGLATVDRELEKPGNEIWSQLMELSINNAEAYDTFLKALFAGISGSLLRWPETAQILSRPIAPTQDYIKREVVVTARAIHKKTDDCLPNELALA